METKKLKKQFRSGVLLCSACACVFSSTLKCTNHYCPKSQPDLPVESRQEPFYPLGRQTIISTASGTAGDTGVAGTTTT